MNPRDALGPRARAVLLPSSKGLPFLENPAAPANELLFERVDMMLQRLCGYTKVGGDLETPNQQMQQL